MNSLEYHQRGLATEARARETIDALRSRNVLLYEEGDILEGLMLRAFGVQDAMREVSALDEAMDAVQEAIDTVEGLSVSALHDALATLRHLRKGGV